MLEVPDVVFIRPCGLIYRVHYTSPVSIESGMLVTCRMQYAKYVSTVL